MNHTSLLKMAVQALAALLFFSIPARGQYILNGSATQLNCNCYELTSATVNQSGSVWNSNKISLSNPFDFAFNVYLGCNDVNGADGIVFMLQPLSTSVGTSGEGMGFSGVTPSIGIALDTYQNGNLNDPAFDHISIQANGQPNHATDLVPPVRISDTSDNVEDCQWHVLRISWDPATKWLRAYFDGNLRVQLQSDLVPFIFGGDPNVFWGFSGATGGSVNVQRFCTALNPGMRSTLPSDTLCLGTPVQFVNSSESFAPISAYYWNFGDGTTSSQMNPPPHLYAASGNYDVSLAVTGADGCRSDTLRRKIKVAALPSGNFTLRDTCPRQAIPIQLTPGADVSYAWQLDGSPIADGPEPQIGASSGPHTIRLTISSPYGCGAPIVIDRPVTIWEAPEFTQAVADGCAGAPWSYSALQTNTVGVTSWRWDFSDGGTSAAISGLRAFADTGFYEIKTEAISVQGCSSGEVSTTIHINRAWADAGPDRVIISSGPTVLQGAGNGAFSWAPASLFTNATQPQPALLPFSDTTIYLTVTTPEGCVAVDSARIEIFTGSDIWVPNAFTPNGDGRNDVFRPRYKGIMQLATFAVYNRWGQPVFQTTDPMRGWDGKNGSIETGNETFVWMIRAVDWAGKVLERKGTVTVIR